MHSGASLDVRLAPAALAGWGVAAVALGWSPGTAIVVAIALWGVAATLLASVRGGRTRLLAVVAALLVAGGAAASAGMRAGAVQAGPLRALASEGASVHLSGRLASDPIQHQGRFAPYVMVSLTVDRVIAHGAATRVRSPVLVIGEVSWLDAAYGDEVDAFGHLQEPSGPDLAAVLIAAGPPVVRRAPGWVERGVGRVRGALVVAAQPLAPAGRALLPALVDGDVSAMPDTTTAEFKATGLTHLLAVSGSNLTLVLEFVLFLASWARVRGYGRGVVGALAVVLFVLLARPDPSVLRAAAMGVVVLAGLAVGPRARGMRVLALAVIGLVLIDPWLARSVGFILSTLATAGILVFGPPWRRLLARWLPRWLAEAVAVPLAAQLVCTPVIAAISGQVSVVAVLANMAVAPAVGPATVASLIAGLTTLASVTLGQLAGRAAGVPLWWITTVAHHGAGLAGATVSWGVGPASLLVLGGVCAVVALALWLLLPRRLPSLAMAGLLVVVLLHPPGPLGWPPAGWVMVMCDVGQGDGLVLNAGHGAAVVVDTGPDPAAMARCLRPLGVRSIPLVVLTHFHSDHITGLGDVADGWAIGEIEVCPYDEPSSGYASVMGVARVHHVPVTVAVLHERRRVGDLRWEVIGPTAQTAAPPPSAGDEAAGDLGTGPNNASIVMRVRVRGIRLLLTGDAEPEEEDAILASGTDVRATVLKEAHHGSASQDPAFLAATQAAVSLISVGADNPYGHPAQQTLDWLRDLGIAVYRTDQRGDIAVGVQSGQPEIVTAQ